MVVTLVLTVPRPQVYLLAHAIVRDLTVAFDPSEFRGRVVALHSADHGDHRGYRTLGHMLEGTHLEGTTPAQVRALCPKGAVVGLGVISSAIPVHGGWRIHLAVARPVVPFPLSVPEPRLSALPIGEWPIEVRQLSHAEPRREDA